VFADFGLIWTVCVCYVMLSIASFLASSTTFTDDYCYGIWKKLYARVFFESFVMRCWRIYALFTFIHPIITVLAEDAIGI